MLTLGVGPRYRFALSLPCPISNRSSACRFAGGAARRGRLALLDGLITARREGRGILEGGGGGSANVMVCRFAGGAARLGRLAALDGLITAGREGRGILESGGDRKSTRLNSSH